MNWMLILSILIITIVIPVAVTGTTAFFGEKAKNVLVEKWGSRGQLYAGGLGTFLHELGHTLVAIIFRHHIDWHQTKLIQFKNLDTSKTLGCVLHTWDTSNFYQNLGNAFIGIAPFFTCSGFLYLVHHYLIGTVYNFTVPNANLNQPSSILLVLQTDMHNLTSSLADDFSHPLMAIIFAVLVFMTSVTGFAISKADWKTCKYGLKQYLLLVVCSAVIILAVGSISPAFSVGIWKLTAVLVFLMLDSWVYVLFSVLFIMAVRYALDKHYRSSISSFNFKSNLRSLIKPRGKHFK